MISDFDYSCDTMTKKMGGGRGGKGEKKACKTDKNFEYSFCGGKPTGRKEHTWGLNVPMHAPCGTATVDIKKKERERERERVSCALSSTSCFQ